MRNRIQGLKYYVSSILDLAEIKLFIAMVGGIVFYQMGIDIEAVKAALIIYVIDVGLGIGIALFKDLLYIYNNGLSTWRYSDKAFSVGKFGWGIIKLILYVVVLIAFNKADIIIYTLIQHGSDANIFQTKYYYLGYIAAHELLSIIKKLAGIGIPVPQELVDRLSKFKKEIK